MHSHSQSSCNQADAGKMPNSARSRISLCQQIVQRVKGDAKQSVKDICSHICQIELNELYFVFKGWSSKSVLRLSSRELYTTIRYEIWRKYKSLDISAVVPFRPAASAQDDGGPLVSRPQVPR